VKKNHKTSSTVVEEAKQRAREKETYAHARTEAIRLKAECARLKAEVASLKDEESHESSERMKQRVEEAQEQAALERQRAQVAESTLTTLEVETAAMEERLARAIDRVDELTAAPCESSFIPKEREEPNCPWRALEVWDGVLAILLETDLSSPPSEDLFDALMRCCEDANARWVILDVASIAPNFEFEHLASCIKAIRMAGADCVICGHTAVLARQLVTCQALWPLTAARSVKDALYRCLERSRNSPFTPAGWELVRRGGGPVTNAG